MRFEAPASQRVQAILARGGIDKRWERELWDGLFLNPTEIDEALEHVRRKARTCYLYPLLVAAAHTGGRRSELLRARVEDIDFDAKLGNLRTQAATAINAHASKAHAAPIIVSSDGQQRSWR